MPAVAGAVSSGVLSMPLRLPPLPNAPFSGVIVETTTHDGHSVRSQNWVARDAAGRTYVDQRASKTAEPDGKFRGSLFTVQDPVKRFVRTCQTETYECVQTKLEKPAVALLMQIDAPGAESLGSDTMSGLTVTHTRDTGMAASSKPGDSLGTTVAATRDVWFSADLQTPLRVVLTDAQAGERQFDLQITRRGKPDSVLFEMPREFKVVDTLTLLQPVVPSSQVERIGPGVSAPVVLHAPDPQFPDEARNMHFSGAVLVSLIVDEYGLRINVRVERPAGHGLDEKAVEAVQRYKFRPAMKNGKPVKVQMNIEVNFQNA